METSQMAETETELTWNLKNTPRVSVVINIYITNNIRFLLAPGNEIAGVQTTTFGFDAPGNRVDIEESCRIESQKLAYYIEVVA